MISTPKSRLRRQRATARFDLRIEKDGNEFRASVIDARVSGAETRFSAPFTNDDLARFRHAIEHPLRDLERGGQNLEDLPQKMGTSLFKAVFSDGVLKAWRDALGRASGGKQRLTVSLHLRDAELEEWPWESLRDPDEDSYLALSPRTPVLRFPVPPSRIPALRIEGPVRILGIVTHPSGCAPLDGEREWSLLQSSLSKLVEAGLVTLERLKPATLFSLRSKLAEGPFHILHFIGHGTFDKVKKQGMLLFEEEPGRTPGVSASELGTILNNEDLRLVVLNACYGARGAANDPFAAVATNLIRRKVAAVVAMQFAVTDQFAVEFSELFYRRLAAGEPVDLAMAETRLDLLPRHQVEWRTPVLYMRSHDTRIFVVGPSPKVLSPHGPEDKETGLGQWARKRWKQVALASLAAGGLTLAAQVWRPTPEPSPECPSAPGLDLKLRLIKRGSTMAGNSLLSVQGSYCIGMYELTRAQQAKIQGAASIPPPDGNLPASGLAYNDAIALLNALNKRDPSGHYRLPTGEEWEYATRAGSRDAYFFGDKVDLLPEYGNCTGTSEGRPMLVGSYKPNKLDLFDTYGNVSEWTSDIREEKNGERKWIRRGGSWDIEPKNCNSAQEFPSQSPDSAREVFGLRIVREPVFPTKQKGAAVKPPPSAPR